jgi:hypothetical protein
MYGCLLLKEDEINAKALEDVGEFRRSKFTKVKLEESDKTTYEDFTFVSNLGTRHYYISAT